MAETRGDDFDFTGMTSEPVTLDDDGVTDSAWLDLGFPIAADPTPTADDTGDHSATLMVIADPQDF